MPTSQHVPSYALDKSLCLPSGDNGFGNRSLLLLCSVVVRLFLNYCSTCGTRLIVLFDSKTTFQFSSIPIAHFFIPLGFAVALLSFDEIRKWVVRTRPNGFLAKIAW